jgi:hypothetical protein
MKDTTGLAFGPWKESGILNPLMKRCIKNRSHIPDSDGKWQMARTRQRHYST